MKISTKKIEVKAILAIKESIMDIDFLSDFISENDKEPSWDGHIYVYHDKENKKEDLRGRIPVQIKGTVNAELSCREIKHNILLSDMKNFLGDGGVVYFVVRIHPNKIENKIYYNALTPTKIADVLETAEEKGNKENKRIKFTEFPSDENGIMNIFVNFIEDSRKQSSFAKNKIMSIEEFEKINGKKELRFSTIGYGYTQNDIEYAFLENEVYPYCKIEGISHEIPLNVIPASCFIDKKLLMEVAVDKRIYYSEVIKRILKDEELLILGKSTKISYDKSGAKPMHLRYDSAPMLKDCIKDTEFIVDVLKNEQISFGGVILPLNMSTDIIKKADIESQEKLLDYLKKTRKLLDVLNIKEDIDLSKLSVDEKNILGTLIASIIDNKIIKKSSGDSIQIVDQITVQNLVLQLYFEELNSDEYRVHDYFSSDIVIAYNDDNGKNICISSKYSALSKEDYTNVSNINYEGILSSYQKILRNNTEIIIYANNDMLKMISAYDEKSNDDLLKVAKSLAEWIIEEDTENKIQHEAKTINLYQILRRERELIDEEKKCLSNFIESPSCNNEIKFGASLLLDSIELALNFFSRLDKEVQETYKEQPIYHFINEKTNPPAMLGRN